MQSQDIKGIKVDKNHKRLQQPHKRTNTVPSWVKTLGGEYQNFWAT
jgi:hypothetical protein